MLFDQALHMILQHLEQYKGATNSALIDLIEGDAVLFEKVKEQLIFNDLAEDKKGVGLVYIGPEADDLLPHQNEEKESIEQAKVVTGDEKYRIFISYGRKDAAELANRMASDLAANGHDVWLDKEQIRTGKSWEEQIEQAILSSDIFISLLTPHAVRRPDGVCLDEISMARYNNRRIIPLMVMNCRPPLGIYRLDWLDLQDWNNPAYYQKTINRLNELLYSDEDSVEGIHAAIFNTLNPLDFKLDIYKHVKDFVGREWLIDDIIQWINTKEENILFITGDPGSGKTALMAKLIHIFPNIGAYHFCISRYEDSLIPEKFIHSIASQLATQIPEYREILTHLNLETIAYQESGTLIKQLIIQPLSQIQDSSPAVIIIDGLDEALVVGKNNIIKLLYDWVEEFPSWVKIIFTSRKVHEIISLFDYYKPYEISVSRIENKLDIEEYIREMFLEKNDGRFKIEKDLVDTIVDRSEGIFLYAKTIVQNLLSKTISVSEINSLPPGLGGIYQKNFKRIFNTEQDYLRVKPILEIILASFQPLTVDDIAKYYKSDKPSVVKLLNKVSEFFPEKDGTISVFHKSVADWLTGDNNQSHQFLCEVTKGHLQISEVLLEDWNKHRHSEYVINYLPKQLFYARQFNQMHELLIHFPYIEIRCAQRQIYRFLEDYKLLINETVSGKSLANIIENQFWDRGRHEYEADIFKSNLNDEKRLLIVHDFLYRQSEAIQLYGDVKDFLKQLVYNEGLVPFIYSLDTIQISNSDTFLYSEIFRDEYNPYPSVTKKYFEHKSGISDLSLSKDNLLVSASFDRTLCLWDLSSGECIRKIKFNNIPETAVIASDSSFITVGGDIADYDIVFYNPELNRVLFKLNGHTDRIGMMKLSRDDRRLVSCSSDRSFIVWDLEKKTIIFEKKYQDNVLSCSISGDGSSVAVSTGGDQVEVWNIDYDVLLFSREFDKGELRTVLLSSDSKEIIIGGGVDKLTEVWNIQSGELIYTIAGHGSSTYCLFLDPGKRLLLSGGKDNYLKLWDYKTGKLLKRFDSHTRVTRRFAVSDDMTTLITGGGWNSDFQIRQRDIFRSLDEQTEGEYMISISEVYDFKDLDLIVGVNWKNIFTIHTKTGEKSLLRKKMTIQLTRLVNKRLYVVQQNGILEVYDFETGTWKEIFKHSEEITSLLVLNENEWIIGDWKGNVITHIQAKTSSFPSVSRNKVKDIQLSEDYFIVLDYDDQFVFIRRKDIQLEDTYKHPERITSNIILISEKIYFGDATGTISILDSGSRSLTASIKALDADVNCIAYHEHSKRLITAFTNGIIKLWDPENLVSLLEFQAHNSSVNIIRVYNGFSFISISGNMYANQQIQGSELKETSMKKWNVYTGECLAVYTADEFITAIDIEEDKEIIIGQRNGRLHVFRHHPAQIPG